MVLEGITLPLILTTAIVDSINPCAIGVMLLLVAVLLRHAKDKRKMVVISTIYILSVFVVYSLSGLGLIWFQAFLIKLGFAKVLGVLVGVLVIAGGLVEIKDFFWYGKGFSLMIPVKYSKMIKKKTEHLSAGAAIVLGAFVAMVELPCTGGPYLAITALLAKQFNTKALFYLFIYNVIFVLPLIIVGVLAFYGHEVNSMKKWKAHTKKWMRLFAGLVMILLGLFLIYYYVFLV